MHLSSPKKSPQRISSNSHQTHQFSEFKTNINDKVSSLPFEGNKNLCQTHTESSANITEAFSYGFDSIFCDKNSFESSPVDLPFMFSNTVHQEAKLDIFGNCGPSISCNVTKEFESLEMPE